MNRIDSYITKINRYPRYLRRLRFSWHLFFDLGICHKQQCTGYRHYSNSFRDSLRVRDVRECSDRCAETSYCKTFSFRHGVESSLELNCLLSSYSNFRLDATSDLLTDINWNLYRRIRNDQCGNSENDRYDNNYGRGNMPF